MSLRISRANRDTTTKVRSRKSNRWRRKSIYGEWGSNVEEVIEDRRKESSRFLDRKVGCDQEWMEQTSTGHSATEAI